MATPGGSSQSGGKAAGKMDVNALLRNLRINESDFDDLVIDEEVVLDEEPSLLAVARVLTDKSFSTLAFEETMRFAWSLAQGVKFWAVGDNTFILQFKCLGDWTKVVEEGPWLFRSWGIVIKGYDGYTKPSSIVLDKLPIWIQIHDVPEAYLRPDILQNMAGRVGKFVSRDTEGIGEGNFVRVQVELDVNKPLERFTSVIRKGKRDVFLVKYEKVPKFCEVCGHMGHEFMECGNGFHKEEDHVFGEWMIADQPRRGRGRGRGGFGTRGARGPGRSGFGRGRGQRDAWIPNVAYAANVEEEIEQESGRSARKRLELGDGKTSEPSPKEGALGLALVVKEGEKEIDDEEMGEPVNETKESPIKIQDKKRQKKAGEEELTSNVDGSAGPLEGYRREQ
jgi:hypothetical protein